MPLFFEEYKDHLELDFNSANTLKLQENSIKVDNVIYKTKLLNLDSSKLTAVKGGLRLVVFYQPILLKPIHVKRQRLTNIVTVSCGFCNEFLCDTKNLTTARKPWDGWYESLSECFCHKTKWTNPALSNEDLVTRNKVLMSDFDLWIPGVKIDKCPNCELDLGQVKEKFSMIWKWKVNLEGSLNYTLSDCIAEYLHSASLRGEFMIYMASHSKCCAIQILNTFTNINNRRCIKFMYYPVTTDEIHLPLNEDLYAKVMRIFKLQTFILPIDKRMDNKLSFLYLN